MLTVGSLALDFAVLSELIPCKSLPALSDSSNTLKKFLFASSFCKGPSWTSPLGIVGFLQISLSNKASSISSDITSVLTTLSWSDCNSSSYSFSADMASLFSSSLPVLNLPIIKYTQVKYEASMHLCA